MVSKKAIVVYIDDKFVFISLTFSSKLKMFSSNHLFNFLLRNAALASGALSAMTITRSKQEKISLLTRGWFFSFFCDDTVISSHKLPGRMKLQMRYLKYNLFWPLSNNICYWIEVSGFYMRGRIERLYFKYLICNFIRPGNLRRDDGTSQKL